MDGTTQNATYADLLQHRINHTVLQRDAVSSAVEEMRLARSLTVADDEHDPEGSTVSLDHARDTALLQRTEHALAELLAAQERLARGTYGVCEMCGVGIPTQRLEVRPEARLCVPCSR